MWKVIAVILIGAVLSGTIDWLIGVSWTDVHPFAHIGHKVVYMAWGSMIVDAMRKKTS